MHTVRQCQQKSTSSVKSFKYMYKHRNTTRCTSMMYGKTINMKVVDRLGRAISANMKVRNLYLKEKCIITSL